MGSGVSHLVGCFIRPRDGASDGGMGVQFSEPLDEGLGHSFCYVRPQPLGSPPLDKSEELSFAKQAPDETFVDAADLTSFSKDDRGHSHGEKSRPSLLDRSRLQFEKPKTPIGARIVSETSFKAISGASVSANTATPRTMMSCEQFNSFSNVLYDRAAAFESTSSFSAIPLQPVPRGFSGPLSGPLDRGERVFMSGALERERGFMSGPLERGFMSGPLERGYMSGPLDPSSDRTPFSAPLNGHYHYGSYLRIRKHSLVRFMRSVSRPMRKAFSRTASSLARTHKSIVTPVKAYMSSRESMKLAKEVAAGDNRDKQQKEGLDSFETSVDFSSELDLRESDNLQWAQGKAGEDRVHVVLSEEHGWLFVGIYDGFNGPDAPDFLMSNLYPAVFQELKGLLWDPKEAESCVVPLEQHAEGIDILSYSETVADRQADGADRIHDEKQIEDVKLMVGGPRRGGFNRKDSRTWQPRNGEKFPVEIAREGEDGALLGLAIDDSSSSSSGLDDSLRRHKDVDGIRRGLSRGCSEGGDSNGREDQDLCLASERIHRSSGPDEDASTSGVMGEGRFVVEQAGKLAEDWGNDGQIDQVESHTRTSDQLEVSETSSVSDQDRKMKKKRVAAGIRLRYGHDRRAEQLRKYFQWRYGWEDKPEEVEEVKNATAPGPDSPGNEKAVDHSSILKALARALQTTESAYLDMADKVLYENPELALMGSCVLVMLMKDEDMYILNVGDSRAILAQHPKVEALTSVLGKGGWHQNNSGSRDSLLRIELERIIEETPMELEALEAAHENGSDGRPPTCGVSLLGALQLTTDHSTNIQEEVLRLRAEHPDDDTIENDRVKGKLKVTRAFGAGFLKQPKWNNALLEMFQINFIGTTPYITCSPALYHHRLGPQDHFLVLSSDGLYQYFSNEEVVSHIEWFMKKFPDGDPAQHLIEELLFRAAKKAGMDFHELLDIPQGDRRKYHDDVSVMIISLEGRIWRSSG